MLGIWGESMGESTWESQVECIRRVHEVGGRGRRDVLEGSTKGFWRGSLTRRFLGRMRGRLAPLTRWYSPQALHR